MAGDHSIEASAHGQDDWFRHSAEDGLPQAEHAAHVSSLGLGLAFVVTTFGVLAMVIGLSLYFNAYTTQLKATRHEGVGSAEKYTEYRNAALKTMRESKAVDRENGVYRVPVDRAMDIIVAEYGGAEQANVARELD